MIYINGTLQLKPQYVSSSFSMYTDNDVPYYLKKIIKNGE